MKHAHSIKIDAKIHDHVPVPMVWHVIECTCGWSTTLHRKEDDARAAYRTHKDAHAPRRRTRKAA